MCLYHYWIIIIVIIIRQKNNQQYQKIGKHRHHDARSDRKMCRIHFLLSLYLNHRCNDSYRSFPLSLTLSLSPRHWTCFICRPRCRPIAPATCNQSLSVGKKKNWEKYLLAILLHIRGSKFGNDNGWQRLLIAKGNSRTFSQPSIPPSPSPIHRHTCKYTTVCVCAYGNLSGGIYAYIYILYI